jgi:hypothetical protein
VIDTTEWPKPIYFWDEDYSGQTLMSCRRHQVRQGGECSKWVSTSGAYPGYFWLGESTDRVWAEICKARVKEDFSGPCGGYWRHEHGCEAGACPIVAPID